MAIKTLRQVPSNKSCEYFTIRHNHNENYVLRAECVEVMRIKHSALGHFRSFRMLWEVVLTKQKLYHRSLKGQGDHQRDPDAMTSREMKMREDLGTHVIRSQITLTI